MPDLTLYPTSDPRPYPTARLFTGIFNRCVATIVSASLVLAPDALRAGPHDEGIAAGQAANPVAHGNVQAPTASSVVPGYTSTPQETTYYRKPNLNTQGQARLAACATQPNDPVCDAQRGAVSSANTPRTAIAPTDPSVTAAREIGRSPSDVLGNLSAFYSGCTTTTTPVPAGTQVRSCLRYDGASVYSCTRQLSVEITRTTNCSPGDWFARAAQGRYSLDVQCFPNRSSSSQHMRVTRDGQVLTIFDLNMDAGAVFPVWVAQLDSHISSDGQSMVRTGMWVANTTCAGGTCSLKAMVADEYRQNCTGSGDTGYSCTQAVPFLPIYAPCGMGTISGDHLQVTKCTDVTDSTSCSSAPMDIGSCYAPSKQKTPLEGSDDTGGSTAQYWVMANPRNVIGWKVNPEYGPPSSIPVIPLTYPQPATTITETDHWDDTCPDPSAMGTAGSASAGARCSALAPPVCTDGPSTKLVDGAPVNRSCWAYSRSMSCSGAAPADQCAPLAASGCTPVSSTCKQTQPGTGLCAVYEDSYSCPVLAQNNTTVSNCPSNVFCLQGNCFNVSSPPDQDFAHSMSLLEAAREAGVYINTDEMEVFKGEMNWCRDRLLKNCCAADSAGAGMSNQTIFGVGSRLVYDVLMNSGNREFLYYGAQALLTSGGFSGSFTSFGVTVAVNGTALPAGSTVIFSGQSVVVAVDPWTLLIAVIIYVVMSMMSCNAEEGRMAMQEGAKLCHTVGTWCSDCHFVHLKCVGCKEHTTSKCCFNSMLARIIQEQGRAQIGKGWGDPKSADCSGFTVTQLQALDFSKMDLSEFYASLVPSMPNLGGLQGQNASRVPSCYYGQGKC